MKKALVKKPRNLELKTVQATPSKPVKTGLSKSDPDYYRKIGLISAQRRQESGSITSEQLSEWARKSHKNRTDYSKGGRKMGSGKQLPQ